jgi:hypothetical protein
MQKIKIKSGSGLYLYHLTIVFLVFFVLVNTYTNVWKIESLDLNLMISVVSFLFGFIITITFSMLLSKMGLLKDALATEAGRLVSLFLLSKQMGKAFHEKIAKRIDDYTVSTLREYTNYNVSRECIYGMYNDCEFMETKTSNQEALAGSFTYILGELEPVREKLEYLTSRRVEWPLKFTNYILGVILIVLLFFNRGEPFTNALFVALSTVVVFIFLIMEDFDNLKIGDYTYNISNSEQVFDLMGKERYYPENVLARAKLERGKKYRVGVKDKSGKEKIVVMEY